MAKQVKEKSMEHPKIALIAIVVALLMSCGRNDNYIIPVDYDKFYEGVNSLTEEQSQELSMKISEEQWNNTIGKEIPDIKVKDPNGKSYRLKKLLKQGSIIIFSAHNCGWGKEEAQKEFPALIREISDELDGIDIFCFVENSKDYDQQQVGDYVWNLQKEYSKIYLIDQDDAMKMNLTACPTKLFINKEQVVSFMHIGYAMEPEARLNIIRAGINEINKEKL